MLLPKSVVPPSGNINKRKYSRQKARRIQCSYYKICFASKLTLNWHWLHQVEKRLVLFLKLHCIEFHNSLKRKYYYRKADWHAQS
jgi:hypothetical protein